MQYLKPRTNTISYFFHKVSEFNYVAGNRLDNKEDVTERLIPLYHNLLNDELQELIDAKDAANELQELCDVAVVSYFLVKLYGEEINGFVPNPVITEGILDQIKGILLSKEVCAEDPECGLNKAIRALLMAMDTLSALNVDMFGSLHNVADSNLSKFVKIGDNVPDDFELDEQMILTLEQAAIALEADGRYKDVQWSRVGDYIVFKDANGKVLKAPTFNSPQLKKYIGKSKKGAK